MGFNKGLFDFIGYMSFFNPIGTGDASDCSVHEEETEEDERDALSEEPNADDWGEV